MLWLNHGWNITNLLAQVNIGVSDSVINLISLIISLAIYVFTSYCFYNIYQKLGEPNAWFAWVPILQNWIMYKAGDQSPWWLIGLFIPLVNIVAAIFLIIAFVNIIKN